MVQMQMEFDREIILSKFDMPPPMKAVLMTCLSDLLHTAPSSCLDQARTDVTIIAAIHHLHQWAQAALSWQQIYRHAVMYAHNHRPLL